MKKSEMIFLIRNYLFSNGLYANLEDPSEITKHSENILEMLEDAGMYPPDTMIEGHLCTMWNSE